jgi:putative Ca2+/H+ antiporter (TMEM165/GDT1 family)
VALGLGARHRTGPVLVGVALAYAASTFLSVVVGGAAGVALPTTVISVIGGMMFLAFAGWTLWSDRDVIFVDATTHTSELPIDAGGSAPPTPIDDDTSSTRLVASVASMMFVAELGDKTMLATATVAARDNPRFVWIGATIGITLAGAVGVIAGRLLGDRLPARAIAIGSTLCFALFGIALITVALW